MGFLCCCEERSEGIAFMRLEEGRLASDIVEVGFSFCTVWTLGRLGIIKEVKLVVCVLPPMEHLNDGSLGSARETTKCSPVILPINRVKNFPRPMFFFTDVLSQIRASGGELKLVAEGASDIASATEERDFCGRDMGHGWQACR